LNGCYFLSHWITPSIPSHHNADAPHCTLYKGLAIGLYMNIDGMLSFHKVEVDGMLSFQKGISYSISYIGKH